MYALNGGEFVQYAVYLYACYCNAGQTRHKDTSQRIAERRSKASFERLHDKLGILLVFTHADAFYVWSFYLKHIVTSLKNELRARAHNACR